MYYTAKVCECPVFIEHKYEGALRAEFGEDEYQRLCQKNSGVSKAIKARLIATDESAPVPSFVRKIFDTILPQGKETATNRTAEPAQADKAAVVEA